MTLKGSVYEIIEKMRKEGKVQTVSKEATVNIKEATVNIEHAMALGLMPIKKEFERKHRNSYHHALETEIKTANDYNL